MKIFNTVIIGADSAGYALKEQIKEKLAADGYSVIDKGTDSDASCHYPIYGGAVAEAVQGANADTCGILVCGTGVGMSMVANKYKGIRAACCSDTFSARMTRAHNDANILCFGARVVGYGLACDLVDAFLSTEFEGGRHQVRVDMITDIENNQK
ncbi:MAG: ribose 5-phosphate isomerase B [Ruminococcaceae bacterium]|nr:ribose 5-phosphate isomerase B [Oscillospiraceae bacterium]